MFCLFVQYPDTVWGVVGCATPVSAEQLLPLNLSARGSSLLRPGINLDFIVVLFSRKKKKPKNSGGMMDKVSILHFQSVSSKHRSVL